jgi:hypothetical protein
MVPMSATGGNDSGRADPQAIPYLLYADAGAAIDWLVRAFGFAVRTCHCGEDGTVRHGELQLDQGGRPTQCPIQKDISGLLLNQSPPEHLPALAW